MRVCVCVFPGLARNNALRFDTHIRCSKEQAVDLQRRALAFAECRRVTVHLSITVHCGPVTGQNVEANAFINYVKTQVSWQMILVL